MPSPAVTMAVVLLIGASGAIVGFLVRAKGMAAHVCRLLLPLVVVMGWQEELSVEICGELSLSLRPAVYDSPKKWSTYESST